MYPLFKKFHRAFKSGNIDRMEKALTKILKEQQKFDSEDEFSIIYNGKALHFNAPDFDKFDIKLKCGFYNIVMNNKQQRIKKEWEKYEFRKNNLRKNDE